MWYKNKKACVAQNNGRAHNIRLTSARGNSINMWNLGFQVGHKQAARFRASLSIDDKWCFSINGWLWMSTWTGPMSSYEFLLSLSLKCSKITTLLQKVPKLVNTLERFLNIINRFYNTYIPWVKTGKIHDIWILTDLLFCLSSSKTRVVLWKRFWNQQGLT